jgi:PAS domain S-box-containing protein
MAVFSNYTLFAAFALSLWNVGNSPADIGAALAIWALATAGVLVTTRPASPQFKWASRALLAFATAYGCASILLLTPLAGAWGWSPGSGLAVSAAILLTALALASNGKPAYERSPTAFLFLLPTVLILFLSLLGQVFQIERSRLFGQLIYMAPLNIGILVLIAAHIISRPPLRWPFNAVTSDYPQIRLLRYMLVFCTVTPIVLGLTFLYGEVHGLLDSREAAVYFVFFSVTLFWGFVIKGAGWAYRVSQMRDLAMRRLEESWRSREAYFRSLVDDSPVILYISSDSGGCTFLSQKWEEYTGVPCIKDLGFGWLERIHPGDRERLKDFAEKTKKLKHEPFSIEFRLRRHDGVYRWVISTGFPRFDDKHRFIGYMGCVVDVHERKVQEDTLIRDKQTAELSNQTKSQFLANMSHEIRTPLNAILGFADLCGDNHCSEGERVEFLKRIRWNGDHLLRLIDDILDLAKMESGSAVVQKTQFSIERTMDEIIASLRALASQKGLRLELVAPPHLPPVVFSDPHRIKQIVTNLVGNAIKFTSQGGVNVRIVPAGDRIEIEISDSGIGLSQEAKQNLFKPFSQGDSSVTRRFGGTGLGLHLSRKLAQSIGGDVTLRASEPGVGSVFSFTFAIGTEVETHRKAVQTARQAGRIPEGAVPVPKRLFGRKILVAEDSVDSRELIEIYFRPTGAQLVFAENGLEAVEMAIKERPDLILMDVQMPGVDGLEATRRLRSSGFNKPIVALTAHALQDEVDRSFEAGCNYHLTKPIMKEVLLSLVSDLLQHSPPAHMHH